MFRIFLLLLYQNGTRLRIWGLQVQVLPSPEINLLVILSLFLDFDFKMRKDMMEMKEESEWVIVKVK